MPLPADADVSTPKYLRNKYATRARAATSPSRRAHAALFGSVARGDAKAASDIDIMSELEPNAPIGVFEYVASPSFWPTFS